MSSPGEPSPRKLGRPGSPGSPPPEEARRLGLNLSLARLPVRSPSLDFARVDNSGASPELSPSRTSPRADRSTLVLSSAGLPGAAAGVPRGPLRGPNNKKMTHQRRASYSIMPDLEGGSAVLTGSGTINLEDRPGPLTRDASVSSLLLMVDSPRILNRVSSTERKPSTGSAAASAASSSPPSSSSASAPSSLTGAAVERKTVSPLERLSRASGSVPPDSPSMMASATDDTSPVRRADRRKLSIDKADGSPQSHVRKASKGLIDAVFSDILSTHGFRSPKGARTSSNADKNDKSPPGTAEETVAVDAVLRGKQDLASTVVRFVTVTVVECKGPLVGHRSCKIKVYKCKSLESKLFSTKWSSKLRHPVWRYASPEIRITSDAAELLIELKEKGSTAPLGSAKLNCFPLSQRGIEEVITEDVQVRLIFLLGGASFCLALFFWAVGDPRVRAVLFALAQAAHAHGN